VIDGFILFIIFPSPENIAVMCLRFQRDYGRASLFGFRSRFSSRSLNHRAVALTIERNRISARIHREVN
jgi:hypothetical protein